MRGVSTVPQKWVTSFTDVPYSTLNFTRYLSVATETKIASSPNRTFSPSERCLEDGWTVHQQDSPGTSSLDYEDTLEQGGFLTQHISSRNIKVPKYTSYDQFLFIKLVFWQAISGWRRVERKTTINSWPRAPGDKKGWKLLF